MLDDGKVIEFNAPYLLLQNSDGFLYKLVEQTGKAEALHLMEMAKAAFNKEELPVSQPDRNVTIVENPAAEKDDLIDDNVKLNNLDKNTNVNAITDDVRTQKAKEIVKTALDNALNEINGQEKAELERSEKENQEMREFKSDGKNIEENEKTEDQGAETEDQGEETEDQGEETEDQGGETEETALLAKDEKESRGKDKINEDADKSDDSSSSSSGSSSDSDTEETALIDKSSGVGTDLKSD